jgi:hypothetical protein
MVAHHWEALAVSDWLVHYLAPVFIMLVVVADMYRLAQ